MFFSDSSVVLMKNVYLEKNNNWIITVCDKFWTTHYKGPTIYLLANFFDKTLHFGNY